MKNIYKKGFTLLELLVVIAIIGVLTAIVLASLGSAKLKGEDTSIQSMLKSVHSQAGLYYSQNGNYGATSATCSGAGSLFADTGQYGLSKLVVALQAKTTIVCGSNATAWSITAQLKNSTNIICVDSTGTQKITAGPMPGTQTVCP